jgi:hypothetical protein
MWHLLLAGAALIYVTGILLVITAWRRPSLPAALRRWRH